MNRDEFWELSKTKSLPSLVKGKDLQNQTPRTLLWGYDCDRNSWHVYLNEDGKIVRVCYAYSNKLVMFDHEDQLSLNEQYVPDKRLYPEACDAEFSGLLIEKGMYMPWTTFNTEREPKLWHGLQINELKDKE